MRQLLTRLSTPPRHPIREARGALPDDGPGGLVERVKAGDHVAGAMLYQRHRPALRRYVRAIVRDDDAAEDVVQQVFIAVFDRIASYRDRGLPFANWLFAIASNAARKHTRAAGRAELTDPTVLDCDREEDAAGSASHSESAVAAFDALTATLSTAQRRVLLLRYGFAMTSCEVADVLEQTPASVRQAHARAVATLAERQSRLGL